VDASTSWPELSIDDYADRTADMVKVWRATNGRQAGDPAKLARALLVLAGQEQPPQRWAAGADAIGGAEMKVAQLKAQVEAARELDMDLAHDDVQAA
jgi:hypothetical protein